MGNTVTLADSVQKLTLTGDEAIIAIDGRNIKIPLFSLKQYLNISATGAVIPAKAPSLNLGAPLDPKVYFGGAGDYTLNGASGSYPENLNLFFWDKSEWNVLEVPIDLENVQATKNVKNPIWGVGDEKGNVIMWIDDDLETHVKLHKDSYQMPQSQSEVMDFAIADEKGNIILGIDRYGNVHPKQNGSTHQDPVQIKPQKTIRAEDITQSSDISKDGLWNQWIEPVGAVDKDGTLWMGSVGHNGNLYVTKRQTNGITQRVKIGHVLSGDISDDHNCPAILLDNRPDADFPVMVFQCDHNTHPLRFWKFSSKDISTWDISVTYNVNSTKVAYTQVFRHADEIFAFSRIPTTDREWRIAWSQDNGETWVSQSVFSSEDRWLYMLCKENNEGTGLNIACHGHPLNSTNQNIYFMQMDFASGALTEPSGSVIIPDIRAAIVNSSFQRVDPFLTALKVFDAQGSEISRLWDVSRNTVGKISIIFNLMPNSARSFANFKNSKYRVVTINASDGSIVDSIEIASAGTPIENPKGANFYFAGASLINSEKAIVCKWESYSQGKDGGDITDDYGMTTVEIIDFLDPLELKRNLICYSDKKVIRPQRVEDFILLAECNYFQDYNDFYSNILINNLQVLNK